MLAISLIFALMACGQAEKTEEVPPPIKTVEKAMDIAPKEVKEHLPWIKIRKNPNKAQRSLQKKAMDFLISNPELSHDTLIAYYRDEPKARKNIVVIIGRMMRDDDLSFLGKALNSPERGVGFAAAQALSESINDEASALLLKGLESKYSDVKKNSLIGLGFRQDVSTCDRVKQHMTDADEIIRFQSIRAAIRIGCREQTDREQLAQKESSEKIMSLLKPKPK